jgi:hypothetical protein
MRKHVLVVLLALVFVVSLSACSSNINDKSTYEKSEFSEESSSLKETEVVSSETELSDQEVIEEWNPDSDRIPSQEELIQYWYDHRDYPLKARSSAWQRYFSMGLLYKMQGPPEDLLKEMDSDELAALLFRYPGGMMSEFAGDTDKMGMDIFKEKCNIFNELTLREDGAHAILKAFSEIPLDIEQATSVNAFQDIGYNAERFIYIYMTCYQDRIPEEDIAYYEEIYQDRYEKYYSDYLRKSSSNSGLFRKVVFSVGDSDRANKTFVYSREAFKELKNIWYERKDYPNLFGDAPSGYCGYSNYPINDITEADIIDILNPPSDLLKTLSTSEIASLTLRYYSQIAFSNWTLGTQLGKTILEDGTTDTFFKYMEKNCDLLKELLKREDGIPCFIDAYGEHRITSSDYASLSKDDMLFYDTIEEYLACRFMDRYLNRFTEEDKQHYYEVYDQKKPLYDQIKDAATREIFETKLSRQRQ